MSEFTTIQIDRQLVEELKNAREYPRQTYNELISNMIKVFQKIKHNDQYDKFLHEIQKPKMKELWDNKYDEVWEHV